MDDKRSDTAGRLYSVEEFDNELDAGTPTCAMCGKPLGIKRAVFSPTGYDEWWCDTDGRAVAWLAVPWMEAVANG